MPQPLLRTTGFLLAVIAAVGFSFKAILVKLAYAVATPIELNAVVLLALYRQFVRSRA